MDPLDTSTVVKKRMCIFPPHVNVRSTMPPSKLPPLRKRGLLVLSKALKLSARRCRPIEEKAFKNGGKLDYGRYIRRLCAGESAPWETDQQSEARKAPSPVESNESVRADGVLKCGKCKSRKIDQVEAQTRSGDEAATLFCLCTSCGNRWKM